jgi:hypothetical protein
VNILEPTAPAPVEVHLRRHDFSRWIADVFGDYRLSKSVRQLEDEYVAGILTDVAASLGQAVRMRYEFVTVEGL